MPISLHRQPIYHQLDAKKIFFSIYWYANKTEKHKNNVIYSIQVQNEYKQTQSVWKSHMANISVRV